VTTLIDTAARQQAQDITGSFAVQAPAGSGKTELLSLRFLRLLAVCEKPEEVLAITFTRKAASEMSNRILSTLTWAANRGSSAAFESQLEEDRYRAGMAVLERNETQAWHLLESPQRLRIQTIDSFCHFLASNLPVLSNLGGALNVSDEPDECYEQAIDELLKLLETDSPISASIANLLLHLDNNIPKVEKLLVELLKQREQWIDAVVDTASSPDATFDYLMQNFQELIEEHLSIVHTQIKDYAEPLVELASFAAANLLDSDCATGIDNCFALQQLPGTSAADLPTWFGLANLLLTANRTSPAWRKKVTKNEGFPAPSNDKEHRALLSARKNAMQELLAELASVQNTELLENLHYLRLLPDLQQEGFSFTLLRDLTALLPTLVAQLQVSFAAHNTVDHIKVSHAALKALGEEDNPTELALLLDYRIKHLLVDEFQDTSSTQLALLNKLTAGWETGDGRTFFVVGDAMQSCYSFRNANVGLFIALRENGIRHLPVTPIDLHANFRSSGGIVEWVNRVFAPSFPPVNNSSRGAVQYSHSTAVHPQGVEPAVTARCYAYENGSRSTAYDAEAAHIVNEIIRLRQRVAGSESKDSDKARESIAILVRSRSYLLHILPALRAANITWLATDIDRLDKLTIVSDLISLTRAISNQADRLAWLALLRAPWSGIPMADLLSLANLHREQTILQILLDPATKESLTPDSAHRIEFLARVLEQAVRNRDRVPLTRLLRHAFARLGGEQLIQSAFEADGVERFFDLVHQLELSGELIDMDEFEEQVEKISISDSPQPGDNNPIQIMTIHKAKGLEFDHVFLPGLDRRPRVDDRELLLWHERLNSEGQRKLFLAALAGAGESSDPMYELLRFEKSVKAKFENTRLMYIGVTRAIKSAHLSAALETRDDALAEPESRTLLATIWDALRQQDLIETVAVQTTANSQQTPIDDLQQATTLRRLPLTSLPTATGPMQVAEKNTGAATDADQDSLGRDEPALQAQMGNIIHDVLQRYVTNKTLIDSEMLDTQKQRWRRDLQASGFEDDAIQQALVFIEASLQTTILNTDLQWVFDNAHNQSSTELALQTRSAGTLRNHIVDRSFIDEQGYRWIIDYKSAAKPAAQSEQQFIDGQTDQHREQLTRYADLFIDEDSEGTKTALLLTSIGKLVELNIG
jgi:ATP-dependent exoDNAse (exonuclease V) beta subunit|tara:strand:+ start:2609 stop:6082 length:3474 start_codon:yes stop_codon:yes gene_type:complete